MGTDDTIGTKTDFPPGPQLLSQPKRSPPLAGTKSYCLVTETHRCKQLAQDHYAVVPSQDSNPRPVKRKFDVPPIAPPVCLLVCLFVSPCISGTIMPGIDKQKTQLPQR